MACSNIVVADTDARRLELLTSSLRRLGYRVLGCEERRECYGLLHRQRPDLAIINLRLEQPNDGWTLVRHLRQDPLTARMPILVYSAHERLAATDIELAGTWWCTIYGQPFELDGLLAQVPHALAAHISPAHR